MATSLIQELTANQFAKLAGLQVSGTIPLQQELVNQILRELLESRSAKGGQQGPSNEKSGVSLTDLAGLVKVVQVRAEPGVIYVDFDIAV